MLAENLLRDHEAPGRLRRMEVGIAHSVYKPPSVPQLIEECFDLVLAEARAISNPFEQSLFVMVQLPYLQPFDDVNKRVSRLAANIPLIKHNLSPLSFVDVDEDTYIRGMLAVYELNRVELIKAVFLWAYERSAARYAEVRQVIGEPDAFRLRYRSELRAAIAGIIRGVVGPRLRKKGWAARTGRSSSKPQKRELLALNEGDYARYQVTPREFAAWREVWTRE
jgi:hypothetical protein